MAEEQSGTHTGLEVQQRRVRCACISLQQLLQSKSLSQGDWSSQMCQQTQLLRQLWMLHGVQVAPGSGFLLPAVQMQ